VHINFPLVFSLSSWVLPAYQASDSYVPDSLKAGILIVLFAALWAEFRPGGAWAFSFYIAHKWLICLLSPFF
jgi:hypothetical protein